MTARILIRSSRRASGLSQKVLGERSGVAASSLSLIESGERIPTVATLERLLAATGRSLVSIPTRRADAAKIAEQIAASLGDGEPASALRHFIQLNDNLTAEHNEVRFALTIAEPSPTGTKHWDAAIAALVEYRLQEEGLPVPTWTCDPARTLRKSWTFSAGRYVVPVDRTRVPKAFLDRKVLIDEDTLMSY
ncbi:helix-turn-helix transcriptional regulator [Salinibacterium sp.]|uniref:helix-turn-helix domain-containing protein n=1 Tax=Salinibacterium sp. TaxID=1915057 RepID=UPI00286CAED2|nr:helix-turn-helix transcriptional regulator [Salinibacterium sp.]